jgi:hypothetical protein
MVGLAISTLFSLLTLASVVFYHFVK